MKITDEAVVAAVQAYMDTRFAGAQFISTPKNRAGMRAALEAALPHLEGATPGSCICGTYLDRDGDPQKDADDPSCPVHGEGATPAIDREALESHLTSALIAADDLVTPGYSARIEADADDIARVVTAAMLARFGDAS